MKSQIEKQITKPIVRLLKSDIGDDDVKSLCENDTKALKELYLADNNISYIGVRHLTKIEFENLIFLDLNGNQIGNRGCKYLSNAMMENLEGLSLNKNQIDNAGVSHLAKRGWPRFKGVSFENNNLSPSGIVPILKSNWKLHWIRLIYNRVAAADFLILLLSEVQIKAFHLLSGSMLIRNQSEFNPRNIMRRLFNDRFGQIHLQL